MLPQNLTPPPPSTLHQQKAASIATQEFNGFFEGIRRNSLTSLSFYRIFISTYNQIKFYMQFSTIKSLALAGFFAVAFTSINAQTTTQRVTLVEQVTSASCGPCASQNPAFRNLLTPNVTNNEIVVVKYQRGGGGYIDPMWDFNPTEVDGRIVNNYGVTWFPNVWINGTDVGAPAGVSQGTLDNANADPATFKLAVTKSINGNDVSIDVSATALQDYQGGIDNQTRIYVALIEKDVDYATAPGTNGETDFYWVMRKMFPNEAGTTIGKQFANDVENVQFNYTVDPNEIDINNLEVVAWVQNSINKNIYNAGSTSTTSVGVGIDEETAGLNDVKVYPTTANNFINIGFNLVENSQINIEIYNAVGKRVYNANRQYTAGKTLERLNISKFSNGMYYAVLRSDREKIAKKFIVTK